MTSLTLLLAVLSNDGHWLSGEQGQISVHWAAPAAATLCDLTWRLKLGDTLLATDLLLIGRHESPVIKIVCPTVRARLALRWEWRLVRKTDRREIAAGSENLMAYPDNLTSDWPALLNGKTIVVVDRASGIPALLQRAKIKHTRLANLTQLGTAVADIVIIGPDMIEDHPFEQTALQSLVKAGTSVAVFRQTRIQQLLGVELAVRAIPDELAWRADDPLLRGFDAEEMQSWRRDWGRGKVSHIRALRVSGGEASRAVVTWPVRSERVGSPALSIAPAVDTLLLSRGGASARGRLVLCQMPLGDWMTDPRSQMFLGNVWDVLISPPARHSGVTSRSADAAPRRSTVATISGGGR